MSTRARFFCPHWLLLLLLVQASPAVADNHQSAVERLQHAAQSRRPWPGPVTGPRAMKDRHILFIAEDLRNGGILGVAQGVHEATVQLGWKLSIVDLQGDTATRAERFAKARAMKPHGIILGGADAVTNQPYLQPFEQAGMAIVGWHAASEPGPIAGTSVRFNVTTNNADVARTAADYVIAHSGGQAKVVIFTDSRFEIARFKAELMAKTLRECAGCEVLSMEDVAISEAEQRMPEKTRELLERFGSRWQYSLAINDIYFDFAAPWLALASQAVQIQNVSAGDGSPSAFSRIRSASFQAGTVPEPLLLHGWQLADELNRLFCGQAPSGFSYPVHIVTGQNIEFDGGPRDLFDPDNNYRYEYRKIWGLAD